MDIVVVVGEVVRSIHPDKGVIIKYIATWYLNVQLIKTFLMDSCSVSGAAIWGLVLLRPHAEDTGGISLHKLYVCYENLPPGYFHS